MSIPVSIDPLGTPGEGWVRVPYGMTVQQVTGRAKLPKRIEYIGATAPADEYQFIGPTDPEDWPSEIFFKASLPDLKKLLFFGNCYSSVVHFVSQSGFASRGFVSGGNVFGRAREIYVDCGTGDLGTTGGIAVNISSKNLRKVDIRLGGQRMDGLTYRYFESPLEEFVLVAPNLNYCDLLWLGNVQVHQAVLLSALRQLPTRENAGGALHIRNTSYVYAVVDTWLTELGIAHSYTAGNPPIINAGEPMPKGWTITYHATIE